MADPADSPIGLLALFGRRIAPVILIELQADPKNIPLTTTQEGRSNIPPTAVQEDPTDISPAAAQDPTDIPPTPPQQQILPVPVAYEVDETDSDRDSFVSADST